MQNMEFYGVFYLIFREAVAIGVVMWQKSRFKWEELIHLFSVVSSSHNGERGWRHQLHILEVRDEGGPQGSHE